MRIAENRRLKLFSDLESYQVRPLNGLTTSERRNTLVSQFIDSIRRIEYVHMLRQAKLDEARCNPESALFDPLKAAVINYRKGNVDEACWLVFVATYCGKHLSDGWELARTLYRGGDASMPWTWMRISGDVNGFRQWLTNAYPSLRSDGVSRRFGNHRKYETLRPDSRRGTSAVFNAYVSWIGHNQGHGLLIQETHDATKGNPKAAFHHLYNQMGQVTSFGRTGRFDFLTMIGKLALADIEPGSPYLIGATGPLAGARLLFGGSREANLRPDVLNGWVIELGDYLDLGMQVMEDALCNWQKNPDTYEPFRG